MNEWTREQAIIDLHADLHAYFSEAAVHSDLATVVDELWNFPIDYRRRILAAHVLSSETTRQAVDAVAALLRRLPPSAARREMEEVGVVHGPVLWDRTVQRRLARADPTVFVTKPTHRSFDTHSARFARLALSKIQTLAAVLSLKTATGVGSDIRLVSEQARELLASEKLQGARRIQKLDSRIQEALLRRHPSLTPLVDLIAGVDDALEGGSPDSLVPAMIGGVFAPNADEDLFELWVGLRLLKGLRAAGATVQTATWQPGFEVRPFATATIAGRVVTIFWQRSHWSLPFLQGLGRYATTLDDNQMALSALRPDFLFVDDGTAPRICMVEVKHTAVRNSSPDRDGIKDCLGYLYDLQGAEPPGSVVCCLVAASRSTAVPGVGRIVVAGYDRLGDPAVIRQLVG